MAYIYLNPIEQQLANARQQLDLLAAQRETVAQNLQNIDQQIAQVHAYIAAVEPLLAQQPPSHLQQMTLADLCRAALEAYAIPIPAQQVRAYLMQLGIRLDYSNEMAVLHNTLRRVGKVAQDQFGNTVYAPKR